MRARTLRRPALMARGLFPCRPRFKGFRKLIRKVWNDGAGASRHEQRHVMACQRPAPIRHQRDIPQAFANHRFPHRRGASRAGSGARSASIARSERRRSPGRAAAAQRGSRKLSKTAARPPGLQWRQKSISIVARSENRGELRKCPAEIKGLPPPFPIVRSMPIARRCLPCLPPRRCGKRWFAKACGMSR